jgi:hypothetical protein
MVRWQGSQALLPAQAGFAAEAADVSATATANGSSR